MKSKMTLLPSRQGATGGDPPPRPNGYQDAATHDYEVKTEEAIELAPALETMSNVQRKKVVKDRQENPNKPIEDVVEDAKTGAKVIQVIATITARVHTALKTFAKEEGRLQDEAAAVLIEEALVGRELLDE